MSCPAELDLTVRDRASFPSQQSRDPRASGDPPLHHYVIVRRDLPVGVGVANVVHAAGESGRLAPALPPGTHAVALTCADEGELLGLAARLRAAGLVTAEIRECECDDAYPGQLMAIGVAPGPRAPVKRLTSHLPLFGKGGG